MGELTAPRGQLADAELPRTHTRSGEVLIALAEIAIVILPFAMARVIGRFFEFLYLGPIAIVICVALATVLLGLRNRRWSDAGLTRPASWPKTVVGALGTFAAIVVVSLILRGIYHIAGVGEPNIERLLVARENWLALAIFLFPLSWGTAAFGEEMLTRGFMLHRLAEALGSTRTAWIFGILAQALFFGLAHTWQGAVGVVNVTLLGLVLGSACYLARGNLWVCILAHGTMDFVTILAIANSP